MEKLKIACLYPQELNLYADEGNVLCLTYRLKKRRINYEIISIGIGDTVPDFDIMLIGGGQDREMALINRDLRKKSEMISYAVSENKVIFAVCAGYQLLGEYYKTSDESIIKMAGAIPFYTVAGKKRITGNLIYDTAFGKIAGFENHAGRTYLLPNVNPLGKVISGFGNNGKDKGEGVLYNNTFCTYAHGPVLPKNPALCDELIRRALKTNELMPLDDKLENSCHNFLIKKFS